MPATEGRIRTLVDDNLEIEGRTAGSPLSLNLSIIDAGVDSASVVAFWKLVCEEFDVEISADEFAELLTQRDLIAFLKARIG